VFAKLSLWFDCVFCVLISVCAKQYLSDDLEVSIIDFFLKQKLLHPVQELIFCTGA
jgi:hypothetical protein